MTNVKEKSDKELEKLLKDSREDLRKFRFGMAGSNKKDAAKPGALRKLIAQILTEQTSRKKGDDENNAK
jgi:ribosomal protein L29